MHLLFQAATPEQPFPRLTETFMMRTESIIRAEALVQSPGYILGPALAPSELEEVRGLIHARWLARITTLRPDKRETFENLPLDRYHEISDLVDHASAWTKEVRLFSPAEVDRLRALSLFPQLEAALGPFEIADIEGLGYPEIYWRLVRPGAPTDVAGAHADAWFYNYTNGLSEAEQASLVKVWVAIHAEPGNSGLAVLPDSHLKDWPHHAELRHGRPKPVLDVEEGSLPFIAAPTLPGEAVAFHIRLLHRGIAHVGSRSRVSLEFAIRLRDADQ